MLTFIKRAILASYVKYMLSWQEAGHELRYAEDYEEFSAWLISLGMSETQVRRAILASCVFQCDFTLMLSAKRFKA